MKFLSDTIVWKLSLLISTLTVKGLIPICRVYYTKKVSYVFMVPSTNQPGFFFLKNSIVFKIKLSTQKNYEEKMK